MDVAFGQRLVDASLVCPQRTAALQKQGNAFEGDTIVMHDLFAFKQTGVDDKRKAQGYFHTTGIRPHCLERLASLGAGLPLELFERRILSPGLA